MKLYAILLLCLLARLTATAPLAADSSEESSSESHESKESEEKKTTTLANTVKDQDDEKSYLDRHPVYKELINRGIMNMSHLEKFKKLIKMILVIKFMNQTDKVPDIEKLPPGKLDHLRDLFEGDMLLTMPQISWVLKMVKKNHGLNETEDIEEGEEDPRAALSSNQQSRWPTQITYRLDTASGVDQNAVLAGLNLWSSMTCLRFVRNDKPSGDHLEYFKGQGCYSYVGRVGGKQQVSIGAGCERIGIVAHETEHALGAWHEQSRYDRDSFIIVNYQNINPSATGNFEKYPQSSFAFPGDVPFEYGSVMHYASTSFTTNNQPTITTKDDRYMNTIGQRDTVSFFDVKAINLAYCGNSCKGVASPQCTHGGYQNPNQCSSCLCPSGLGGTTCNEGRAAGSCGTLNLVATSSWQTLSITGAKQCNHLIKASSGKVKIELQTIGFSCGGVCTYGFAELKLGSDFRPTGHRVCCSNQTNRGGTSATNEAVVIYNGASGSDKLTLRYMQGKKNELTQNITTGFQFWKLNLYQQ